jgi:hypothetical protein
MRYQELTNEDKKAVQLLLSEQGEFYESRSNELYALDKPETLIMQIPFIRIWELLMMARRPVFAAHAVCVNLEAIYQMLDEGNYKFANLPAELQNESCCRAYQHAIEWVLDLLYDSEYPIYSKSIQTVRDMTGKGEK